MTSKYDTFDENTQTEQTKISHLSELKELELKDISICPFGAKRKANENRIMTLHDNGMRNVTIANILTDNNPEGAEWTEEQVDGIVRYLEVHSDRVLIKKGTYKNALNPKK